MTSTTNRPVDQSRDAYVAQTIRSQIAVSTFMTLGASDLMRDGADFTFRARIIPTGKQAPRVMRVTVHLNGMDLYDVKVIFTPSKWADPVTHFERTDVYAKDLNRVLFALDREG